MKDRGLYILVLELEKNQGIKAGKLPKTEFKAGLYLYVGRARRGLKQRLERHLRKHKKLFWHIDYFLRKAEVIDVWIKPNSFDECRTVSQIRKFIKASVIPQKRFGASDCHCPSHLLFLPEVKDLENLRRRLAFKQGIPIMHLCASLR
jgi:sugar fermentation stimulation protein A